ncbi:dTMP kinase [Hansschlegelia quercus]|uniref:Thymidylate kinase n=1 Tax=Hansschlegelia quercus TaxID=2528245 RepID=A0A4Q9GJB2_9HYPH|nr:dTMP kinase [Hansschlegelia quercus]TBN54333.1 dTMP kinase [Hansschlegelia quercus]
MAQRGLFVAVEGGDGAGKSGVIVALMRHLEARGVSALATREPGGTAEGEQLRALLLSGDGEAWDPRSELLLMTAARVQHVQHVIMPAVARGEVVVSDRFVGSTIAYQGAGRGLPLPLIRILHDQAVGGLLPDLTLVLDVDPRTGIARSRKRLDASAIDEARFEGLDLGFHDRVRSSFLDQAAQAPERHAVIDASLEPEAVQSAAIAAVDCLLA